MTSPNWFFGCPKCEAGMMRVLYHGHDEDRYPVRLYQCKNCQHRFGTEERVISDNAFFARAWSGNFRSAWRYRQKVLLCKVCPDSYRGGTYAVHKESAKHRASMKSLRGSEDQRRSYARSHVA